MNLMIKDGYPVLMASARAARFLLGFSAIALAYWAFDHAAVTNMRRTNPEEAYRARPTDPGAMAGVINNRIVARNQFEVSADDAANARAGLRKDPLNGVLLRTLGVYAEMNGKQPIALQAMQMASNVSRRDSITELWLAEYNRRNGDLAKTLVHYDAAMLVRPDLQKALFPQMTSALAEAGFRSAVQPYIERKASWAVPFVGTAAGADIDNFIGLVDPVIDRMTSRDYEPAFAKIMHRLMARGEGRRALALAPRVFKGFDAKAFAALGWNRTTTDPRFGTLAWSFEQAGNLDASLNDRSTLSVTVSPLASGKVAERDILVTPGALYRLRHVIDYGQSSTQAQVRWTAGCVGEQSASAFWQGDVPLAGGQQEYRAAILLPPSCSLMRLSISAIGSDAQVPSEFSISGLQVGGR